MQMFMIKGQHATVVAGAQIALQIVEVVSGSGKAWSSSGKSDNSDTLERECNSARISLDGFIKQAAK